jgi:hypothetical protein
VVDSDDLKQVGSLTIIEIIDSMGRNRPGVNPSSVSQKDFFSHYRTCGQHADDLNDTGEYTICCFRVLFGNVFIRLL